MFDIDNSKLTLPIDAFGNLSGKAIEIHQPALDTYNSEWFYRTPSGKLVFRCPDKGATTEGTKYPRTELRSLTDYKHTQASSRDIKLAVNQSVQGQNLTIMQVHGGDAPWARVVWSDGKIKAYIRLDVNTEVKDTIIDGISLNQKMSIKIDYDGVNALCVEAKKKTALGFYTGERKCYNMNRVGTYFYKAGAYPTDNSGLGNIYKITHEVN